ncbi:hypothetical protein [Ruegeria sp. R14_0]|uniref:hypothetical protein n=1 Tax=Ruegeria sp. R14_0 TaxID=2821100 RepID=UPI001ADD155D|nr:hypothetical protein [Ruegeria sp. R14_0]MBO9446451.1 hypothetical protein [Ruegeria sp. R14_0]
MSNVKSLGDISKSVLAILALGSAAIGGMAGFLAFYLNFQKELEAWEQIKTTHSQHLEAENVTIHNHKDLSEGDIERIHEALVEHNPLLDADFLAQKWDEEGVFLTYNDLEYEFALVGLKNGAGRQDNRALSMVVRFGDSLSLLTPKGVRLLATNQNAVSVDPRPEHQSAGTTLWTVETGQ